MSSKGIASLLAISCLVSSLIAFSPVTDAQSRLAEIKRFAPDQSNVLLEPRVAPAVHRSGEFFFVIVNGRLLTTVDAVSGEYTHIFDLGVDTGAAIEAHPVVPLSLSSDGSILAVPANGLVQFFDVGREGQLTLASQVEAPTDAGVPVFFSTDNELAIFASGPQGAVTSVKVSSGKILDSIPLSIDETPIDTLADERSQMVSVVTKRDVLVFRYETDGNLRSKGSYRRETTETEYTPGTLTLGRRGRAVFMVEEGGRAIVGLNIRNAKQSARDNADSRDRFDGPMATSPDELTIVATAVSASSGAPSAFYFYEAKGRGLSKNRPKLLPIPEPWGRVERLLFDRSGELLLATFPDTQRIALIDPKTREILDDTVAIGSPHGVAFHPDSHSILISGSASSSPLGAGAPGAVTLLPITRREFSEATAARFSSLPGALFSTADRAFTFANKSHAVVSSGAADAIYSFNVHSLSEIARIDVGPSTGFMALAPDNRTLVISGRGGLMVVRVEDSGAFVTVGPVAVGAVPHDLAPTISFHPSLPYAYVTSGDSVWRVDLLVGGAQRFRVGSAGSSLTNPKVSATGGRLYVIQGLDTLIRLDLDSSGAPSIVNAIAFDATLDAHAPRVAYDAEGLKMWVTDNGVVRQIDLLLGFETGTSDSRAIGNYPVIIGDGQLAVFPPGPGAISLFDVGGSRPVFAAELAVGGAVFAPLPGGTIGIDTLTQTLYLPMPGSSKIVSVQVPSGSPNDVDTTSAAAHVFVLPGSRQLAYPDLSEFPGSVVIANLQ